MNRLRDRRWFPLLWAVPAALVLLVAAVLVARAVRDSDGGAAFLAAYPGDVPLPEWAPVGFPWWLSWQHALNAFLLVFIVRSGWLIRRRQRPPAFVTRDNERFPRTATPPQRRSIHVWWHLVVDSLWALNGVLYVVLLFASGQWVRLVPLDWGVVPNAVSAGLQYLSLDWPMHDGWVNYNSLQQLAYGATVFLAGPLALLTGLRLSPAWGPGWRVNRLLTERVTRGIHFWVMVYFVVFTIGHVALVFATGALRNLNHMYAGRDDGSWVGFWVFAATTAVMVAGWVLLRVPVQTRLARAYGDVRVMPAPPPRG